MRRLLSRLGVDHPVLHKPDLEVARELVEHAGVDFDRLRSEGFLRVGPPRGSAPFADGGFPTPSGRIELLDPLPTYVPPHEATDDVLAERLPLVLLAPAGRFFLNSPFAQLPWHRAKQGPPTVFLSPADAACAPSPRLANGMYFLRLIKKGNSRTEIKLQKLVFVNY